jgi:hypothetical protein
MRDLEMRLFGNEAFCQNPSFEMRDFALSKRDFAK